MRAAIIASAALLLGGCSTLGAILDAIPAPTPQEQCEDGGGHWKSITTYDANGNPTGGGGECIQGDGRDHGKRK